MKVNQSLLKTWMLCPLQAKYKYEERLPWKQNAKASFGTIIHHCLDHYAWHNDLDVAIAMFKDNWQNPEKLNVTPETWPRGNTFAGLREKGIEILRTQHEQLKWISREVVATEHRFCVPFGDHEISGIVDLIEIRKAGNGRRTLRLTDYKTNSVQPKLNTLRLDIQFTTYVYASLQPEFWLGFSAEYPAMNDGQKWWDEVQKLPRKPIWHHLWTGKEIDAGNREDGDFERLYRLLKEVERAQALDIHIPSINADSCLYCDYTDKCRFVIPARQQEALEEPDGVSI